MVSSCGRELGHHLMTKGLSNLLSQRVFEVDRRAISFRLTDGRMGEERRRTEVVGVLSSSK